MIILKLPVRIVHNLLVNITIFMFKTVIHSATNDKIKETSSKNIYTSAKTVYSTNTCLSKRRL